MKGKYFNCHKLGHFANKCPRLHGEGSNAQVNAIEAVPAAGVPPPRDTERAALEVKFSFFGKKYLLYFKSNIFIYLPKHSKALNLKLKIPPIC